MIENTQNKFSRYKVFVKETIAVVRRAFAEFLLIPTCVIIGFLLLAFGSYLLDSVQFGSLAIFRVFLKTHIFADAKATSSLLGAIASGIITMTSITISLLLLAVQQSAGSMTSQVFDQFLRRWHNQFYFGFFIVLALYSLITLATVNDPYNPVFGCTIALLGTIAALYLLLLLLYTTINQMRPVNIVEAIHDLILKARETQLHYISQTRSVSLYDGRVKVPVKAETHGFVTHIHFEKIEKAIKEIETEIVLLFSVGDFVAYQDVIAEVKAETNADADKIVQCVRAAVELERQRDISLDPAYGIQQLSMIAWTSISTAKSNPAPGLLTIFGLRDILSRWSTDKDVSIIGKSFPWFIPTMFSSDYWRRLKHSASSPPNQCSTNLTSKFCTVLQRCSTV